MELVSWRIKNKRIGYTHKCHAKRNGFTILSGMKNQNRYNVHWKNQTTGWSSSERALEEDWGRGNLGIKFPISDTSVYVVLYFASSLKEAELNCEHTGVATYRLTAGKII